MNSVKLQDTKLIHRNLLHFYILTTKEQKKNRIEDLYSENYKTLMEETEDDTNRWKYILCSGIGRINIVKNDYTS